MLESFSQGYSRVTWGKEANIPCDTGLYLLHCTQAVGELWCILGNLAKPNKHKCFYKAYSQREQNVTCWLIKGQACWEMAIRSASG